MGDANQVRLAPLIGLNSVSGCIVAPAAVADATECRCYSMLHARTANRLRGTRYESLSRMRRAFSAGASEAVSLSTELRAEGGSAAARARQSGDPAAVRPEAGGTAAKNR